MRLGRVGIEIALGREGAVVVGQFALLEVERPRAVIHPRQQPRHPAGAAPQRFALERRGGAQAAGLREIALETHFEPGRGVFGFDLFEFVDAVAHPLATAGGFLLAGGVRAHAEALRVQQ